jgi:hypothetical protein
MKLAATAATLLLTLAAAGPAEARPPRSFFGVGPQAGLGESDFARMAAGGVGTVRIALSWPQADPHPPYGGLRWAAPDALVDGAARHGIRVLPVFYGVPSWVATDLDGRHCYPRCQSFLPRSSGALRAWSAFVGRAVRRYGPGGRFWDAHPTVPPLPIRSWQIWNEQNSGQYARPQPAVGRYADLVTASSRAISSRDAGADVVLGGMFGHPNNGEVAGTGSADFLRMLYRRKGIERRFDGIAIHPYGSRFAGVRRQVIELRKVARRAGDARAQTWITEIGWASGGLEHPLNAGPEGQARRLTQTYRYFIRNRRRWNVQLVSWFSWRDATGSHVCEWCPESGLFEAAYGLQPKPAWHAYTSFTGGM